MTLKKVAAEVQQPGRDCKKFDPVKRAKEIFTALDLNGQYSLNIIISIQSLTVAIFYLRRQATVQSQRMNLLEVAKVTALF